MLRLVVIIDFDGTVFDILDVEDGMNVEREASGPGPDLVEVEHHGVVFHFEALHFAVGFLIKI